jgi:hypothetical protein
MAKRNKAKIKGFFRGQIIDRSGRVCGDSDWVENVTTNVGIQNLGSSILGPTGGNSVVCARIATQTAAVNVTQVDLLGYENSFRLPTTSATTGAGAMTCQFTASFAGSNNSDTIAVGAAGLDIATPVNATQTTNSLVNAQTFTTSNMATNQDFNLTYQVRFTTA